ncbi:hypothetical protein [Faecalimicrobium dakarense]|uniref:hypothetical protein n=1 Tax=Faecalimicrobium dakarense TaxID=1301100 RepID=UPI0004AE8B01|nr:hypothetical protein [[Clostridium] dakarense]
MENFLENEVHYIIKATSNDNPNKAGLVYDKGRDPGDNVGMFRYEGRLSIPLTIKIHARAI